MIAFAYIAGALVVAVAMWWWIREHAEHEDRWTFERKMEAVKRAEDEARRWR